MLFRPFAQLSLSAGASEVSQAMPLNDDNAVQLGMVISYIASANAVAAVIQISNDAENWYDKATVSWNAAASTVGQFMQASPTTALGAAYFRLKVTAHASAAVQLAITANSSKQ